MTLPNGIIVAWKGAVVDIPTGWHLCNGAGGTIDLRDKFIVGAGSTYDPADTGGAATHTHAFTSDLHHHHLVVDGDIEEGPKWDNQVDDVAVTGTTDAGSSLPPYYALCWIQKI